ncbi:hypothetical protein BASA82_000423 [Batrachochytrium salamandrivorans]|nr:hypothetical protein BASA82_000423 [Batrachochytrium salamandrivorans]
MDSGALGQELKRKLKKGQQHGQRAKVHRHSSASAHPTRTPKPSPALPSPALPVAATSPTPSTANTTSNTPPPAILKPLVPKLYLEEAASTPLHKPREEEDEEDLTLSSPSLSVQKPSPLRNKMISMEEDNDGWEEDLILPPEPALLD